jgi:hypothetical protein
MPTYSSTDPTAGFEDSNLITLQEENICTAKPRYTCTHDSDMGLAPGGDFSRKWHPFGHVVHRACKFWDDSVSE